MFIITSTDANMEVFHMIEQEETEKKAKKAKDKINKSETVKNGRPYWFQVMVNGKRVTKRGFRTKGEAQKARAEYETQLYKGEYIDPARITYGNYFIEWLEGRNNIADSTRELYLSYYKAHIDPLLGKMSLSKITPSDIQKFIKSLRDKNLSDETVKRIYSTVNASLNSAVTMEIISKNAASKIPKQDKPKVERKEHEIWKNESIKQVLKDSREATRYWIAVFLAVMTGMRQGEILGLKWTDIDYERSVIHIRRGLKKDKTGFTNLKTAGSKRTISISPLTVWVLEEQKQRIDLEKEALGDTYQDNGLVVCTSLGTPAKATKVLHAWNRICEQFKPKDEPDMTFHDLRHLSASIMLNERADIRVVSQRLGHSTVQTTLNVYSHLLPNAQEADASNMDSLVGFKYESNNLLQ
jgi:integrase